MIYQGKSNEYLQLENIKCNSSFQSKVILENPLTFLWFETGDNSICIDNNMIRPLQNQIICLTEFHQVDINSVCNAKLLRFNRPFYCIIEHDSEVGCKGILFFGASTLPIFTIPELELEKFQTLWKMFEMEMHSKDELQQEMLQSMLKRFMIMSTRIFKTQNQYNNIAANKIGILREYNFLVEQHFKTKHTVTEYATLLNKSPKTLSNLFAKISSKTPLQYIQDRKILEAKRLLLYTDKSIKEIAYEIGFEDSQIFGRFFKNSLGISPTEFKENRSVGTIASF